MISIFVMYSPDRAEALARTLAFLRDMPLYDRCQKTLVVDGRPDPVPDGWEAVRVPRLDGRFCWGRMWDAGVATARHPVVLYLDSDRLLPPDLLTQVADRAADDTFVFTSRHYPMLRPLPEDACKRLLAQIGREGSLVDGEFLGAVNFEPRFGQPVHGPGKNAMSGSTAFTRRTYLRLGGVDHWYCGHGAFADSDFHQQAALAGCRFVDLGLPELHYPHPKLGPGEAALDPRTLRLLALENFVHYCLKWGLPLALAEDMAHRSGIARPARYLDQKLREFRAAARGPG